MKTNILSGLAAVIGLVLAAGTTLGQSPQTDPTPAERQSRSNLAVLGQALSRYLVYHDGRLPGRISDLYKEGLVLDLGTFVCPASGKRITEESQIDALTSYEMATTLGPERPLLLFREKEAWHAGRALAFYSDRSIRALGARAADGVPALIGLTAAEAKGALARLGYGEVRFVAAEGPPPSADKQFTVQRQEPAPGAAVDRTKPVTLYVYARAADAGPVVARSVPSVVGLGAAEAKRKLAAAGYSKVAFAAADAPTPSKDRQLTIQRQEPAAGTAADSKEPVTLFVFPPATDPGP